MVKYHEIIITDFLREEAARYSKQNTKKGNFDSRLDVGDNCYTGVLAEMLLYYFLPGLSYENKVGYDFLSKNGVKYEVKSNKSNRPPRDSHSLLIPLHKLGKIHDYAIIFVVQIDSSYRRGWLCGQIEKKEFEKIAVVKTPNDLKANGKPYLNNCYKLDYRFLKPFQN